MDEKGKQRYANSSPKQTSEALMSPWGSRFHVCNVVFSGQESAYVRSADGDTAKVQTGIQCLNREGQEKASVLSCLSVVLFSSSLSKKSKACQQTHSEFFISVVKRKLSEYNIVLS